MRNPENMSLDEVLHEIERLRPRFAEADEIADGLRDLEDHLEHDADQSDADDKRKPS